MDDRTRTLVGIILMMVVAIVPSILFNNREVVPPEPVQVDGVVAPPQSDASPAPPLSSLDMQPEITAPDVRPESPGVREGEAVPAPARTVTVSSDLYRYRFSTRGGRLQTATMLEHASFNPADSAADAQLLPEDGEFLTYGLLFGNDTVSTSDWHFEPSVDHLELGDGPARLVWVAQRGRVTVTIEQTFRPDNFLFDVSGRIEGLAGDVPLVLVRIGPRLRPLEADERTEARSLGVVTKTDKTRSTRFNKLEANGVEPLDGPFEWVAVKSKYFLAAVMAIEEGQPRFGGGITQGTGGNNENGAYVTASLPLSGDRFSHAVYVGPQESQHLSMVGHDIEDANPYGWIFRPIVRPVSAVVLRALVWGHDKLNFAYGWLLVLFGVAVRILIWPLNAKAMRSQMAMQAVQGEMESIKQRHADNQQKIQEETLKLYRERGINPVGGCLPMLLPMPVLLAFFFVFMNAIELRGVPFMWLPDLSAKDPFYIIPLLMGGSMFMVTKLGQAGAPPNPQMKIFQYVMPVMFTLMFMNFASGLNLYYASQNIASLPQQWLIGRERKRKAGGS